MPERSVTIRLTAQDSFSSVIDQYKTKMGEAEDKTAAAGQATDTAATKVDRMGSMLRTALTAAVVTQIADVAAEFVNMGTGIDQTRTRFEALAGPMGDVDGLMERLREASLGTATDFGLQQGSNLLMQMGLANSPEELESMIGMVTRLKSPTEDLNSAIENFSLTLANQSVERLDSFGISSGNVRDRINELLESGEALNREEAFTMAVMEEGKLSIDRLGASAEVAGTAINRMSTKWQNLVNSLAEGAAELAEDAAETLETGLIAGDQLLQSAQIVIGQHPEQIRQREERAGIAQEDIEAMFPEAMVIAASQNLSETFTESFLNNVSQLLQENPLLADNPELLRNLAGQRLTPAETNYPTDTGLLTPITTGGFDPSLNSLVQLAIDTRTENEAIATTLEQQTAYMDRLNTQWATLTASTGTMDTSLAAAGDSTDALVADLEAMVEVSPNVAVDMQQIADQMVIASENAPAIVNDALAMSNAFTDVANQTTAIAHQLTMLASKTHKVKVQIEVDVTGDGSEWLAQQVRNAGGVVPGTIP